MVPSPVSTSSEPPKCPWAWQPFTPRGVAAFAAASSGYLFFIQVLVALLGTACIVWFLWTGWFPVIREAIRHLPTEGVIENHVLKAPIDPAEPLGFSRLLGITADPEEQGTTGLTTDLLVQFKKNKVRFCSLPGCTDLPYASIAKSSYILFNRTELEPQWDAWEPILLTIAAVGSFFALLGSWNVLATIYLLPVWLFAWSQKKDLNLGASWRLAGAALMPGALLFSAAIVSYKLGVIDLVSLFTLSLIHIVVGWVYIVTSTMGLPKKELKIGPASPFATDLVPEKSTPLAEGAKAIGSTERPSVAPDSALEMMGNEPLRPTIETPTPHPIQKIPDENPS
jgi:hypothetical protein